MFINRNLSDGNGLQGMMQAMALFSFWTLFALGAVVFAAGTSVGPPAVGSVTVAIGLALGVALFAFDWTVSPAAAAGLVALIAAASLFRPGLRVPRWFGAGFTSAQSAALLVAAGAPVGVAFAIAVMLVLVAFVLGTRSAEFAPARLHEEALVLLVGGGLVLAAAPEAMAGWNSALALNASTTQSAAGPIPGWLWACLGIAALGGALSRWRRND